MYPEEFVQPMREELTRIGFQELRTAQEVDELLTKIQRHRAGGRQFHLRLCSRTGAAGRRYSA